MSLRLFVRLLFSGLLGALLVVTVGAALQFHEIATMSRDVIGPDARVLQSVGEMQRLLGAPDRGPSFEAAFRQRLDDIESAAIADAVVPSVEQAFESWLDVREKPEADRADAALRLAVAELGTAAGGQAGKTAESIEVAGQAAALGLGILGALALVVGAWLSRAIGRSLIDRLTALDLAVASIDRGDKMRRVGLGGSDELARAAAALDRFLDDRDRAEAQALGRGCELRALLVALLRDQHRPAAITGIDGEVIVSSLSAREEDALRSITPQVRRAARTLLSRGFSSAADLTTEIQIDGAHFVSIRALAAGERRVVGWLAVFAPR